MRQPLYRLVSIVVLTLLACLVACGPSEKAKRPQKTAKELKAVQKPAEPAKPKGKPFAVLDTDKGRIVIQLLPEIAPKTVENFEKLVDLGFYRKTRFFRVMPGQMIQGGDPNTKDNDPYNDGQGNSGSQIPAEFNSTRFERGTVAMARQPSDPDSASCQFFIVLKRVSQWDRQYTAFGKVVEGIDVAEKISNSKLSKDPRLRLWPVENIRINSATMEYR